MVAQRSNGSGASSLTEAILASVFISYAKADRRILERLLLLLRRPWRTVFWDDHLETGAAWSRELHEELFSARCVVVLWSRNALRSGWVRHEATVAAERGVIVSVIVDDVSTDELPPPFRHGPSVKLDHLTGNGKQLLVERVHRALARSRLQRAWAVLGTCIALGAFGQLAWPVACNLWYSERAGILRLEYGQRSTRENEDLGRAVQSARRIDLLMPDANEWTQLVKDELPAFFEKGGRMRVLFAQPDGAFDRELAMMIAGPNKPYGDALVNVATPAGILESNAGSREGALEIRYFNGPIAVPMIIFDGAACQMSLTLPPGPEPESLRLEFDPAARLRADSVAYFESVWRRSTARASH